MVLEDAVLADGALGEQGFLVGDAEHGAVLGVFGEDGDGFGDGVGVHREVGVEEEDDVAGGVFDAEVAGGAGAAVAFGADQGDGVGGGERGGVVGAGVVDDDHLVHGVALGEDGAEAEVDGAAVVVHRHDHRDERCGGHGSSFGTAGGVNGLGFPVSSFR